MVHSRQGIFFFLSLYLPATHSVQHRLIFLSININPTYIQICKIFTLDRKSAQGVHLILSLLEHGLHVIRHERLTNPEQKYSKRVFFFFFHIILN